MFLSSPLPLLRFSPNRSGLFKKLAAGCSRETYLQATYLYPANLPACLPSYLPTYLTSKLPVLFFISTWILTIPTYPTVPIVPIYLLWLTAPGQRGEDPVLQPGDYSYPFQFLIPNINVPTSVEGKYGYVRYWLKGIVDRPWRFDITTIAAFTVLEYVDINTPLLLVIV